MRGHRVAATALPVGMFRHCEPQLGLQRLSRDAALPLSRPRMPLSALQLRPPSTANSSIWPRLSPHPRGVAGKASTMAAAKSNAVAQVADALFGTAAHSLRIAVVREGPRGRVADRKPSMGRVWPPIEAGALAASSTAGGQLWVGSLASVARPERLPPLGIGCVVSIVDELSTASAAAGRLGRLGVVHEVIVVRDRPDAAALLASEWPRVLAAFSLAKGRGKSTLLHCHAGISRSVATALAVLTATEAAGGMGQPLPVAARAVLLGRPQARPNDGLVGALLGWGAGGGGAGSSGAGLATAGSHRSAADGPAGPGRTDDRSVGGVPRPAGAERPCAASPPAAGSVGSCSASGPEAAATALLALPSMQRYLPSTAGKP